jgi:hypothetical protein
MNKQYCIDERKMAEIQKLRREMELPFEPESKEDTY